ncbi:MAG: hypothetical protein UV76_C0010G0024 [Candidatus Nomurabacteria bacterium GW2011_GWA2_43_15]|uniref:Uncharacterized protein n=1 Tax=Candidatus Nomurabacteria bacterium GW2011_GWA2_43_15 TaxID=1618738 RepID=A0A0G1GNZ1_9BACT|nr:MAG: hypothetical protein UV76_C0010G0024 [Candidatus Nomurabacteria bacterium GW2011_GWA2_43_15]
MSFLFNFLGVEEEEQQQAVWERIKAAWAEDCPGSSVNGLQFTALLTGVAVLVVLIKWGREIATFFGW